MAKSDRPDDKPGRQPRPDDQRTDDDGQTRRRYLISARKIRPADRDVSGPVLRGPHAHYRDLVSSDDNPQVPLGAPVSYEAWLTDDEAAAFRSASNVRVVEQDVITPPTYVTLPATASLAWMNASLAQQGSLDGSGVKVCILDGGTTAAVRAQCSWTVAAERIIPAGAPAVQGSHGCLVTPMAVPPAGQLIEGQVAAFADGSAYQSDMAIGIVWGCDQGAKVINLSFGTIGGTAVQAFKDACAYARDRGVQICIAAGNDAATDIASPGYVTREFENVHAIGAIDRATNNIASFSNRNADLAGVAPGVNEPSLATDGTGATWSGTSCASPMAAGLIALLCTGGTYTPQQAANALRTTARDLGLGVNVQGRGAWSLANAKAALVAGIPSGGLMRASRSSNQIINNNTSTRLAFDLVEASDPNVTPNAGKDVFTLNTTGEYLVVLAGRWGGGASAPGDRWCHIGPNVPWDAAGGKTWAHWSEKGSTSPLDFTISTVIKVTAGQQICGWAWQNCGGAWTMEYAAAHPDNRLMSLAVRYLGA